MGLTSYIRSAFSSIRARRSGAHANEGGNVDGESVRRTDAATSASSQTKERLLLALAALRGGVWDWDLTNGYLFLNDDCLRMLGYEPGDLVEHIDTWIELLHPDDTAATFDALDVHFAEREPFDIEYRVRGHNGEYVWLRALGQAVWEDDGTVSRMVGTVQDISERRAAEQRQERMLHELDHRVKNNLAAVMALFDANAATAVSIEELRHGFRGRLLAMARTHESLAKEQWEGMSLSDAVHVAVRPYLSGGGEQRVVITGDDIALPPRWGPPLGLALHELATNAAKHGALSTEGGRVAISWSAIGDAGGVEFLWTERGGPATAPPATRGLGLRLLEGLVEYEIGGTVSVSFQPEGFVCEMKLPALESCA